MLARAVRRVAGRLWVACALVFLCSCSTVTIEEADGTVRIERHLGFVSIQPVPAEMAQVVSLTGLGLVGFQGDLIVGFHRAEFAALPRRCHLLLWIEEGAQLEYLRDTLKQMEQVCVVTTSS